MRFANKINEKSHAKMWTQCFFLVELLKSFTFLIIHGMEMFDKINVLKNLKI